MIAYSTIPVDHARPLPKYSAITGVYATVKNPYSHEDQRVKLEALRLCHDTNWNGFFVFDVIGIAAHVTQGFSVRPDEIRSLAIHVRYWFM